MPKCEVSLPVSFPVDCASDLGAIVLSGKLLERKFDAAKASYAILGYGIATFGPLSTSGEGTLSLEDPPTQEEVLQTLQQLQVGETAAVLDKTKITRLILWLLQNVIPLVLAG